ncbi:MAG: hypothetical protein K8T10_19705 [Candidatus Eremiobacteraeota bacterium]|nr:hypothetical protein [Candidatus Eremiobacteraeota bacterium]
MKKILLWVMVIAFVFSVATAIYAGTADPNAKTGVTPTRTLDYIHLGAQAIRQEFVWDEASGTFQTVNLYSIGEVDDFIAEREQVLQYGAEGDGEIIGDAADYTYWDGTQWVTLDNITRYEGYDERAEAIVTRYDLTYWTQSTSYYESVTGYQTLYGTSYATRVVRHDPYYYTYTSAYLYPTGSVAQIGTFSVVTNVPDSFDPVLEVDLANGWNVTVNSHYTVWGHEVQITSPNGETSYVYGDPHLLQAGGTQQQELAAIGNYVFDLGGYTLDLSCMESNAGFSLVTDFTITGPNDYSMSYGRNGEVKIEGGTN